MAESEVIYCLRKRATGMLMKEMRHLILSPGRKDPSHPDLVAWHV